MGHSNLDWSKTDRATSRRGGKAPAQGGGAEWDLCTGDGVNPAADDNAIEAPSRGKRLRWLWGWRGTTNASASEGHFATQPTSMVSRVLGQVTSTLFASIRSLTPWGPRADKSRSRSGVNRTKVDKHWTITLKGDENKPEAVKRQLDFYFSDSNLPFGLVRSRCDISWRE